MAPLQSRILALLVLLSLSACTSQEIHKRGLASEQMARPKDLSAIREFDQRDGCTLEQQHFIDLTLTSLPDTFIQLKKKLTFSCSTASSYSGHAPKSLLNVSMKNHLQSWKVVIKSKVPPSDSILRKRIVRAIALAYDHENDASQGESWRALSAWKGKKIPFVGTIRRIVHTENINKDGFADPLGMKSPRLDFATYAEEFFSTELSTLKCRTPSKFKHFRKLFPDYAGVQNDALCPPVETWINPSEVDSLELFIASAMSSAPESVAGHLMLRVKMKYHEASGISKDTEDPDDPVISIVANVPRFVGNLEMTMNGITGEYPSLIQTLRLGDVIMNSNYLEDRDLRRFQLTLTRDQIRQVLERLYETKNSFNYDYAFFTNNCATLLIKQIATALGDYKLLNEADVVGSPDTFTEMLLRHGYAEQVFPTFYSRSKKAELSRAEQKKILAKYLGKPESPFTEQALRKVGSTTTLERADGYILLRDIAIAPHATAEGALDVYQWLSLQRNVEEAWEMEKYLKENDQSKSPYNAVLDTVYKLREVLKGSPNASIVALAGLKKGDFLVTAQNIYAKESDKITYEYEKKILVVQGKAADREHLAIAARLGLPADFIGHSHSKDDITRIAAYNELIKIAQAGPSAATEDAIRFVVFMHPFERTLEIDRFLDLGHAEDPDFNYQTMLLSFYRFRSALADSSDQYLRTVASLNRDDFFTRMAYWRHAKLTDDDSYSWIADVTFNFGKYELEEVKRRQLEIAAQTGLDPALVQQSWGTENQPREDAYKRIIEKFAACRGENNDKLLMFLIYSWRVESDIAATKGTQIHQANKSLEGLKRVLVRVLVRSPAKLAPDFANRTELTDVQLLEKDHEASEAEIGSARSGFSPVTLSTGTAVMNWKGVYQMTVDTGQYAQSIGDPSRFVIGKNNLSLQVMPTRLVITMDPAKGMDLSGSGALLDFVKSAEKYGHPQTIFDGKFGISVRVLEYSNSRWTDRPSEWTWINPNVVATIAASPDFMNYLNVSVGAEVGNSLIMNDQGTTYIGWAGVPMHLDSQITLGQRKQAQLSLQGEYVPRFGSAGMDQYATASLTGTWLLGNYKKAEVRLKVQTQAEYYHYREYILAGQKGPAVFSLQAGLNIRIK